MYTYIERVKSLELYRIVFFVGISLALLTVFISSEKNSLYKAVTSNRACSSPVEKRDFAWNSFLPDDALERSLLYFGNGCRLQKVLKKLLSGEGIVGVSLGGSVAAGTGVGNFEDAYPALFFGWLNATFPPRNGSHEFIYAGRGATTSGTFANCLRSFLPVEESFDLVILDFSVNDKIETNEAFEAPPRMAFELLMRGILELPGRPAVLLLHYYSWWHAYKGNRSGSYYGYRDGQGPEDELSVIARYYEVPTFSLKTAAYPLMAAGIPGFRVDRVGNAKQVRDFSFPVSSYEDDWQPYFYGDPMHPNNNGHRALADILRYGLLYGLRHLSASPCALGLNGLPPIMIQGNKDEIQCGCFLNPYYFGTEFDTVKASIKYNEGFEYVPQKRDQANVTEMTLVAKHKRAREKYGWVATEPGSQVDVIIPRCSTDSTSSFRTIMDIGYMRSYENFGRAQVTCADGCRCEGVVLDALWKDLSSQVDTQPIEVVFKKESIEEEDCIVSIRVLNETSSTQHKFSLMYVRLKIEAQRDTSDDEYKRAWKNWIGVT